MKIVCTFPGRYGDLLWACPTLRALAEYAGEPVDLIIAGEYASIVPLLAAQSYLGMVAADQSWKVVQSAPMTPRTPPVFATDRRTVHLGYLGWPDAPLPEYIWLIAQGAVGGFPDLPPLDLTRPWIEAPPEPGAKVVVGFTDEHFELKYGLWRLLPPDLPTWNVSASPGSRWAKEAGRSVEGWLTVAGRISKSCVFFGCNSALHVLACALGVPVVMMEPNSQRHHPIFYPYGKCGPQVTLVTGNDWLPTWDARHVQQTLRDVLIRTERT